MKYKFNDYCIGKDLIELVQEADNLSDGHGYELLMSLMEAVPASQNNWGWGAYVPGTQAWNVSSQVKSHNAAQDKQQQDYTKLQQYLQAKQAAKTISPQEQEHLKQINATLSAGPKWKRFSDEDSAVTHGNIASQYGMKLGGSPVQPKPRTPRVKPAPGSPPAPPTGSTPGTAPGSPPAPPTGSTPGTAPGSPPAPPTTPAPADLATLQTYMQKQFTSVATAISDLKNQLAALKSGSAAPPPPPAAAAAPPPPPAAAAAASSRKGKGAATPAVVPPPPAPVASAPVSKGKSKVPVKKNPTAGTGS